MVPLPTSAENHQALNARALQEAGAAVHLDQKRLTAEVLWGTIAGLVEDPQALDTMSERARERSRPDATPDIVGEIVGLLRDPKPGGV